MPRLAVSDTIEVPVSIKLQEGSNTVPHAFTLFAKRQTQEQVEAAADRLDAKLISYGEYLGSVLTGWRGQQLVVNDDGAPAEFSREALDVLLSLAAMPRAIFGAYLDAVCVTATPAGRAKK